MNAKVIPNHVMVNVQLENDIALNMEWSALSHAFDLFFKKKSFLSLFTQEIVNILSMI